MYTNQCLTDADITLDWDDLKDKCRIGSCPLCYGIEYISVVPMDLCDCTFFGRVCNSLMMASANPELTPRLLYNEEEVTVPLIGRCPSCFDELNMQMRGSTMNVRAILEEYEGIDRIQKVSNHVAVEMAGSDSICSLNCRERVLTYRRYLSCWRCRGTTNECSKCVLRYWLTVHTSSAVSFRRLASTIFCRPTINNDTTLNVQMSNVVEKPAHFATSPGAVNDRMQAVRGQWRSCFDVRRRYKCLEHEGHGNDRYCPDCMVVRMKEILMKSKEQNYDSYKRWALWMKDDLDLLAAMRVLCWSYPMKDHANSLVMDEAEQKRENESRGENPMSQVPGESRVDVCFFTWSPFVVEPIITKDSTNCGHTSEGRNVFKLKVHPHSLKRLALKTCLQVYKEPRVISPNEFIRKRKMEEESRPRKRSKRLLKRKRDEAQTSSKKCKYALPTIYE